MTDTTICKKEIKTNMEGRRHSLDFAFGFNNANFSDRTLLLDLIPDSTSSKPDSIQHSNGHGVVQSNGHPSGTDCSSTKMKTIHINTMILAANSPFFYKLFSNGMTETNQRYVTLSIQESEEAALMDLLKFMYTNTLSRTTPSALVDILVGADKYEVASCMKYCFRLLSKSPMTCELALLYLDLPSTILMGDTIQPLKDAAKEFLVARFKDISKFQEEMLNLPLSGIEAILSSDDLEVSSEDEIYDFVMMWSQRHYTKLGERQEMLITRLIRLIRFPFMSRSKLEEFLTCTDINLEYRSKLVFDALSHETPHRELPLVKEQERAYKLRPLKVIRFPEECVVYLDLKREECTCLLPSGKIRSRYFDLGGQAFYLTGMRIVEQNSAHSFGLLLGMQANPSVARLVVEYEFSYKTKLSTVFVATNKASGNFAECTEIGSRNLFGATWTTFIAENSNFFINGVLRLRATLKIKEIKEK